MGVFPIIMKEIFNFSDNNNYSFRSGTHLSRPILPTTHYRKFISLLQILEQKYGNWYHKILNKQTPSLFLKSKDDPCRLCRT